MLSSAFGLVQQDKNRNTSEYNLKGGLIIQKFDFGSITGKVFVHHTAVFKGFDLHTAIAATAVLRLRLGLHALPSATFHLPFVIDWAVGGSGFIGCSFGDLCKGTACNSSQCPAYYRAAPRISFVYQSACDSSHACAHSSTFIVGLCGLCTGPYGTRNGT